MAKHQMELGEFSFNKIKAGRKLDMRLFDKKRQALKIGDTIEYINYNNPIEHMECKVQGFAVFDNFSTMIDCLTPNLMGYCDKEEILIRLNRAYSTEQQKDFNVIAIFIEDVTPPLLETLRGAKER